MDLNKVKDTATNAYNKLDDQQKEQLKEKGKEAASALKDKVTKSK